ncbi:MAG: transketolase-like TK C-terminal-containing protein, partial [Muribaculaceae bacterium]
GHVMAIGCAIAERFLVARFGDTLAHKTYAYISDGGIQEEISQGAARIAGHLGLNNLIMFYDSNNVQLSTDVDDVTAEDTAAKYRAWHWNVIEIDGTDPVAICQAIETANAEQKRPTLIIGHTVMGKGCVTADGENFEGKCSTHGQPLSASGASYENTIKNLGGDPTNPWVIFDDVKALYESRKQQLSVIAAQRKEAHRLWAEANPELNAELEGFLAGKLPDINYKSIAHKPNIATRASSADVLSVLGEKMHNIIVSSADLANSDKTDAFLKKTSAFRPGDFSGAFLHAGVSELTMAAIMNGIALHGGLRAACATFFVFSDYMKPVIRMSALMELPVVYIYTHDAFRVGEDGPTHQPIEQEAQMRLMEQIKNFSGKNSVLVLRPADSAETTIAWKMAIENQDSPTALILSRQNINDIPSVSGDRYSDALQMTRGGYVVKPCDNPDVILVGNGSEVSTLCDAAGIIATKGIKARVVSVPSIGLFLDQDADYRKSVITPGVKTFGLTAGLPSTLVSVVGVEGTVFGLNHFGASASYKVLDEKFGFTPAAVADKIMNAIN